MWEEACVSIFGILKTAFVVFSLSVFYVEFHLSKKESGNFTAVCPQFSQAQQRLILKVMYKSSLCLEELIHPQLIE